ncbi:uncharacterized protein METZ01_LOCUS157435 [marine metagenome]|uniref:Calcineurin-like phosphoesterase domain-containing protein n=1 Tax=marine metagenome TaxID=408172 RepID=A0A382ATF7_9ZZZZ
MSLKFVQMSDPQLGFYASRHPDTEGIDYEIKNLSKAIEITNQISPDFVITTGDLMQDRLESSHADIVKKMYSELNCNYYFAPGNADLTNTPEFEDIERYKKRFGADHYSFYHMNSQFIILNSCVLFDWSKVAGENSKQITFLEQQLQTGRQNKSSHQLIFMHHPLFGTDPEEEDSHMVLPKSQRSIILDVLERYNVTAVFTGHWHANNILTYKNTQLITSGPITFSLGEDHSGIRIIEVDGDNLTHKYIEL